MKKTFLIILASCLLLSSCRSISDKPRIEVSGSAVVSMAADTSSFTVSAECVAPTTEEARAEMDRMIGEAVAVLKDSYGISDKDLKTGMLNLSPEYTWVDNQRVLSGQRAYQSVTVSFDDISSLGAVVGDLSKINGISVSSITLDKKNTDQEERLARKLAMADALEKAGDYASSVGKKVGAVIYIGDGSGAEAYPVSSRNSLTVAKLDAAASYATSYYAYELEVADTVHLVVELE